MDALIITTLQSADDPVEIVERKGLGHPDTICDALAEALSRALCREYRDRFGAILHHNVDKALLCGGRAAPAFGGGTVLAPIQLYFAGRAVAEAAGEIIPIRDIAVDSARRWFADNMHALDAERHLQIHERIQPGSIDLQALFSRKGGEVTLANDSSIGVGYAPLSALERLVLAVEREMNGRNRASQHPAWGEDIKVMGIRRGAALDLTVACAMIGRHLRHTDDYLAEKAAVAALVRSLAAEHGFTDCDVAVNLADDAAAGSIYLTVTGTSAEAGDDGEVGRGNRVNGLITPCRPMSLEAAAGKNPVSHVGKLYNVLARQIADAIAATHPPIAKVECLVASKIGAPVTAPAIVHIRPTTADGVLPAGFKERAAEIVSDCIAYLPHLVDAFIAGTIQLF